MAMKHTAGAGFVFLIAVLALPPSLSAQVSVAGYTPGSFRVTESGHAEYRIALRVPPGVAGVEPKLMLGYNSQGNNGALGVGWGLSGLSAIHRCGKTLVQDGTTLGVSYTWDDRYCLDGQRLVAISGSYGGHGTEYRTERESFAKVVSFGVAGNGPESFKVWTKAGQIIEYGNTADSRIEAQGKSTVRAWAINRISDTKGNHLTVTYAEDNANGDYRPVRVDYTGNTTAGSAPFASVRFLYASRGDINPIYVAGSVMKVMERLSNVKTYVGENLVTDYRLAYDQGGVAAGSRLLSITECNGAGTECLGLTSLTWQASTGQSGFASARNWGSGYFGFASFIADANGDGLGDLIYSDQANVFVSYSNGTTFSSPTLIGSAPVVCVSVSDFGCTSGYTRFAAGDLNGDGRADVVMGNGSVYLSNGAGFTSAGAWGPQFTVAAFIVDANGDGLGDLIYAQQANVFVSYSTGTGFSGASLIGSAPFICVNADDWGCNAGYAHFAAGDVDGDGRADIVMGDGSVYLSNGAGFASAGNWGQQFTAAAFIADANGDGLGDLIYAQQRELYVRYSTGVGFSGPGLISAWFSTPFVCVRSDGLSCLSGYTVFAAGDVDGDGRADVVAGDGLASVATAPTPDLVSKVTDGLGAEAVFAYKPLTDGSVYAPDSGAVWPVRDVLRQGPLYVVSSLSASNGISGYRVTNYFYRGAKAHMRGGGFLGFRQVEATDTPTGIKSVGTFRQNYPFHGLPLQTLPQQSLGTPIAQTDNSWADTTLMPAPSSGGNYHRVELAQMVERAYELNGSLVTTVTTTNSNIDAFGNVGTVTVSSADGFSKTTTNTYTNDSANWLLGRLTRAQLTSTIPGPVSQTRTSAFAYDPSSGLLTKEIVEPDQSDFCLVTEYQIDAFGNRTSATTRNCNGLAGEAAAPTGLASFAQRQSTSTYAAGSVVIGGTPFSHPAGQFATSSTNAAGHSENRQFDPRFGVPVSLTGPNGLTTTWTYDSFGRKTQENRADGTTTTWAYAVCGVCPTFGRIQVTESSTGAPTKITYFDGLNRELRSEVQGFDGAPAKKDTEYDAFGRTRRVSLPYFGVALKWICFGYDILGRVTSESRPTDTNDNSACNSPAATTTAYNGLITTVTNALNQTETRIKNSQGQLIRVTRE